MVNERLPSTVVLNLKGVNKYLDSQVTKPEPRTRKAVKSPDTHNRFNGINVEVLYIGVFYDPRLQSTQGFWSYTPR